MVAGLKRDHKRLESDTAGAFADPIDRHMRNGGSLPQGGNCGGRSEIVVAVEVSLDRKAETLLELPGTAGGPLRGKGPKGIDQAL